MAFLGMTGIGRTASRNLEILVRVVEGSSDVAAAVRLFTRIACYVSQRHEKRSTELLKVPLKVGAMWRQP